MKKIMALTLSALMLVSSTVAMTVSAEKDNSDNSSSTVNDVKNGTILHAFCWDFNTIRQSMPDIASAGYSAVQTSPINTCTVGENGGMELYGNGKWYYHYQPNDYTIGNYQLGTKDEFKAMCDEAHKYGIKVIVDVMANHTTPETKEISKEWLEAGGGSLDTMCHQNYKKIMTDFGDRLQCTTYTLFGPDINTELPSWQEYFFKFINECSACGADGFRYDSAKHIGLPDDPKENDGLSNNFWEKVKTETKDYENKFIYAEVLQGDNDRLEDYIKYVGCAPASNYGGTLRSALANNNLSVADLEDYQIGDAPKNIVTWVESHDTYCNDDGQTWKVITEEQAILGWAFITARKDGTPLMFDRPYHSNRNAEWGMNRIGAQGDDMYKDKRVSAVNFFRLAMKGQEEKLSNPNSDTTAVMVERGKKGLVIVNTQNELQTGFPVSLSDGTYTNRIDDTTVYTVKDGKLTSEKPVAQNSIVVLYNDGYQKKTPQANVGVAKNTVFKTTQSSTEITLTLENTDKGTYSINGGKAVEYKNGDKITLNNSDGDVVRVELRAENKEHSSTYERVEITFDNTNTIMLIGILVAVVLIGVLTAVIILLIRRKKHRKTVS